MDDHLAKPVRLPVLAETLERWLAQPGSGLHALAEASPHTSDLLDDAILADLGTLPADDLATVLASWDNTTEQRLADLRGSTAEADTLTRLAHSVKGSSASVAARRLAAVAAELEELGRTAVEAGQRLDVSGAEVLLDRLDEEFRQVRPVLQAALLGGSLA
jgi:HPt (histidine-containing phosphotransfer) domain-containing protein